MEESTIRLISNSHNRKKFVYLDERDDDQYFLGIHPDGRILNLEYSLFEDDVEEFAFKTKDELLSVITAEQDEGLKKYTKERE